MAMTHSADSLHHFIFENTPIRGNLVHLNQTFHDVLQHQTLPLVLKKALGELMAASVLLSSTLKMEGTLILQIQNKGALKLLVVECNSTLQIRATAKWSGEIADHTAFLDLIQQAHCIITLDPKEGEPYQGIVPIEGETIAEMLEHYMLRSQQIDTKLWLNCDGENVAGMLIQKLPELPLQDADAWNRINLLANTVSMQELQTLSPQQLLSRLFSEEDIRLFAAKPTQFHCSCNRTSVSNMLHMLGRAEIESILAEQGNITVNCDFCNRQYRFDAVDAATIFVSEPMLKATQSLH
ncbi:MAG: Hsp33 family molecular chaperone HslO [Methylophilaceae bacterium]